MKMYSDAIDEFILDINYFFLQENKIFCKMS